MSRDTDQAALGYAREHGRMLKEIGRLEKLASDFAYALDLLQRNVREASYAGTNGPHLSLRRALERADTVLDAYLAAADGTLPHRHSCPSCGIMDGFEHDASCPRRSK